MTTNYPTSIDTFVNPTSNDSLNSPSHSQQHANLNDAMVAVQTKLGADNANKVGMYLVNKTDWTSATTVVLNNIFSSTYDNYLIVINAKSASSTSAVYAKLRSAGTDTSTNGYGYSESYLQFTTTPSWVLGGSAGTSGLFFGTLATLDQHIQLFLANPATTKIKTWSSAGVRTDGYSHKTDGYANYSTSYDGLSIFFPTSTGTVRVYGLRNS